jgi:hypothetical protein
MSGGIGAYLSFAARSFLPLSGASSLLLKSAIRRRLSFVFGGETFRTVY